MSDSAWKKAESSSEPVAGSTAALIELIPPNASAGALCRRTGDKASSGTAMRASRATVGLGAVARASAARGLRSPCARRRERA